MPLRPGKRRSPTRQGRPSSPCRGNRLSRAGAADVGSNRARLDGSRLASSAGRRGTTARRTRCTVRRRTNSRSNRAARAVARVGDVEVALLSKAKPIRNAKSRYKGEFGCPERYLETADERLRSHTKDCNHAPTRITARPRCGQARARRQQGHGTADRSVRGGRSRGVGLVTAPFRTPGSDLGSLGRYRPARLPDVPTTRGPCYNRYGLLRLVQLALAPGRRGSLE